jgi:hypothetical protein
VTALAGRPRGSEYLAWTKARRGIRYSLSRSGAPRLPLERLAPPTGYLLATDDNEDGWLPLRDALAARHGVASAQVVTVPGCSSANHVAMATALEPGDDVLIETPVYEPLVSLARYLGARVIPFERRESNGWRTDPDDVRRALTPKTRLVVLSNLHNPTGAFDDEASLGAVAAAAASAGACVLVDEVYLEFLHPEGVRSAVHLGSNVMVSSSMTKCWGLDSLRMGWILAEAGLAERARRLNDLFSANNSHPGERLALLALARADELLAEINALLGRNNARVDAFVHSRPELSWVRPRAGTCGFVRADGIDVDELSERLARDHQTGIVPGRFFGAPDHFRLAWGVDEDTLRAGLANVGTALDRR